jgi:epoxyqueuosine reductase
MSDKEGIMSNAKEMEELTGFVKEMAARLGAPIVGINTTETLEGGAPSTDLSYVLPTARSAVTFALPMDQDLIEPFFKKEDHDAHNKNNTRTNTMASGISLELSAFLRQKGHAAAPLCANVEYRSDTPNSFFDEHPPISHRYLAVRSGVGYFGLSGNVITKSDGAAVILGSVVTQAELIPTAPLPEEDNYCDECGLCIAACASGLMDKKEKTVVTMGGVSFSYSMRHDHVRCDYVCGGFAGLHQSEKWSTWSPSRYPIPETDDGFKAIFPEAAVAYLQRPGPDGYMYHFLMPGHNLEFTCGNCQLICHPDKEIRKKRYQMLVSSGVVIQYPDGTRKSVSPEEATAHIEKLDRKSRTLYEKL